MIERDPCGLRDLLVSVVEGYYGFYIPHSTASGRWPGDSGLLPGDWREGLSSGEGFGFDASVARRLTAVEMVRDTIRTAILRGDLPGDSRLVQTDVANRLGVSTTPVREAMRDLASEGLIRLDSHRIGTVRRPDWDEMVEIVEMRHALELVAIRRAMDHVTDSEMNEARAFADDLAEEEDVGSWVQKNIEFHSVFHRATRTTRLANVLLALEQSGGVFVAQAQRLQPEIRRRAVSDHYALLEAYESHDEERAHQVQLGHIKLPLDAVELDSEL